MLPLGTGPVALGPDAAVPEGPVAAAPAVSLGMATALCRRGDGGGEVTAFDPDAANEEGEWCSVRPT